MNPPVCLQHPAARRWRQRATAAVELYVLMLATVMLIVPTGLDIPAGFTINVPAFATIVPVRTLGLPAVCTP
jgi:invasion protein IalB